MSTSQIKPIKVYGAGGPNPPKVAIILEELGIPYEIDPVPFSDVKKPAYLAINPNGRLPSIQDPNTGITLWESGAIIEYLIERYDANHSLSFSAGSPEYYHAKQWLFFQTTGQAPYFGQAAWFTKFHPEKIPSAQERYYNEIARVSGVLDTFLAKQKKESSSGDGPWLVGNKLSYADMSFISWYNAIGMVLGKAEFDVDKFPTLKEWLDKMLARKSVKKVFDALPKHH